LVIVSAAEGPCKQHDDHDHVSEEHNASGHVLPALDAEAALHTVQARYRSIALRRSGRLICRSHFTWSRLLRCTGGIGVDDMMIISIVAG
jgi:hypothetical protein